MISGAQRLAAILAVAAAFPTTEAMAQDAAVARADTAVFTPADFEQFHPTTAMDMVNRIPGFDFNGGDVVRGFSGAGGNVLIDGRRPASKADALSDILGRLSAADVERIELIRGGADGVDMQGHTVVANVIRRTGATVHGQNSLALVLFPDDPTTWNLNIDWSRRAGGRTLELAFFANDTLSTAGNADGTRTRNGTSPYVADVEGFAIRYNLSFKAAYSTPFAGGDLSVRGLASWGRPETEETIDYGGGVLDRFETEVPRVIGEAGLNYRRAMGENTRGELVLLRRRDSADSLSTSRTGAGLSVFDTESTYDESIARATATHRLSDALTVEAGAEAAVNRLDSLTRFLLNQTPQTVPNAVVTVREDRREAFATARWNPSARLSLEGGVRVESSTLAEDGDVDLTKSFRFVKPRAVASWSPTEQDQLRLRIERHVGQLDFNDFAASASFTTGTVDAGNADLEPEKRWIAELAWERRFWGTSSLVLTATHQQLEDVLDRVPVGAFDALGNVGDGRRDILRLDLTTPLDRLGVPRAQMKIEAVWTDSEVTDPVTGRDRIISNDAPLSASLNFSQELRSDIRWGFDLSPMQESTAYRVFESRRSETGVSMGVFYERKLRGGYTLYAYAANLLEDRLVRDRLVYSGRREVSPVAYREVRDVHYAPWIYIRLRRSY